MESTAGHWIAMVAFVIAAISDWFDGYFARKYGMVTPLGKLLDPLADKVLVCSAFVYLSARGGCPVWVTVLILAREFLITGLRQIAVEAGQVLAADRLGKWKTGLQLTYCITCLVWFAVDASGSGNPFLRLLHFPVRSGVVAHPGVAVAGLGPDAGFRLELHVDQPRLGSGAVRWDPGEKP